MSFSAYPAFLTTHGVEDILRPKFLPVTSPSMTTEARRQPTILVVDDEKENCDLFSEVLSSEGNYHVECAYNGQQALDMAQATRYDVIISDITMPKLDGLSFLKELKRRNAEVEVIMISGAGSIDSAVDAFKSQAFDFLAKPLEIDRLLTTVKNALSKSEITRMVSELATTLPFAELNDPDMMLGHILVSQDGTILAASQRLLDSVGLRVSNPKGAALKSFAQLKFLNMTVEHSLEEGCDLLRRWAVLGLKDRLRILAFSARYIPTLPGGPGVLTVVEDTTRLRRQEREKRDRERLSAIGGMTSVVSQQVVGILGGIAGHADSLAQEVQSLTSRRPNITQVVANTDAACATIKRSSDKIANLLSTLQDFSRQFVPQYEPLSLNELLEKAAGQVSDIPDGVEAKFDLEDNIQPVMGNSKDLVQVLVNLIENAIQAVHGKGSISLATRMVTPELACVEVTDDGEGIPVENLDRIFEPFFTTRGDRGKGLGLALARKVIDDHDGVINVVSQPGKGSTFTITLPVQG
jgi:signal transduction histidine kinase